MTDKTIPTNYDDLLLATRPRVIGDEAEYQRQLEWMDRIMMAEGPNPSCEARIQIADLLAVTIGAWEDKVSPMPVVDPREKLIHTMDARGLSKAGLAKVLGVSRALITSIANGDRAISRAMAQKLAAHFDHPIEFYIRAKSDAA